MEIFFFLYIDTYGSDDLGLYVTTASPSRLYCSRTLHTHTPPLPPTPSCLQIPVSLSSMLFSLNYTRTIYLSLPALCALQAQIQRPERIPRLGFRLLGRRSHPLRQLPGQRGGGGGGFGGRGRDQNCGSLRPFAISKAPTGGKKGKKGDSRPIMGPRGDLCVLLRWVEDGEYSCRARRWDGCFAPLLASHHCWQASSPAYHLIRQLLDVCCL